MTYAETYERIQAIRPRGRTGLTPQQTRIMRYVAAGATTREIADDLHISQHTVKRHLSSIYADLGAANRPQAVALLDDRAPGWRNWRA